ncbi:lytic transglycosylase domain-containing protein [Flavicella sp.]|uniref:lytic transglycosylase domain-containing protein n=1 Tax=Flavicella sp. TaxID=2957742 RepID=UPI0030188AE9
MNTINKILLSITAISISLSLFIYSTKEPTKNTSESYQIKALKIPNNISFCGEIAPLYKPDVRERIDRELLVNTYWQSNALLLIKRSNKYFPIIEPILKKNGVPNDFKYLAVIESGLQNVTSSAGAKGFWQLMPHTAKEYGLEVNSNVDERYHIEKATEAACKYLLKSKEKFGTWTLAAAAYNAGNRGISRYQEKQKVTDYYDLLLNTETKRYIPRVLALKEILSHPQQYGFIYDQEDLYNLNKTKLVKVDTAISNIAIFSKQMNCNYKELKINNPWLKENKLNNKSRKVYYIKIPE